MKRLIASILLVAMLLACFAGCGSNASADPTAAPATDPAATGETVSAVDNDVASALAYLKTIYKNVAEKTGADFERVAIVPVGTVKYDVVWTADVAEDLVKITYADGKAIIDVNEESAEEVNYVLTATLTLSLIHI